MVLSTVNSNNPTESLVVINNDKIVDYRNGTEEQCRITPKDDIYWLMTNPDASLTTIHSHVARSIASIQDFVTLNASDGVKAMTVIIPDGNFYTMKKTGQQKLSKAEIDELRKEYDNLMQEIIVSAEEKVGEIFDLKTKLISSNQIFSTSLTKEDKKRIQDEISLLEKEVIDLEMKSFHDFWMSHSQKLGISIETDIDCLK